MCIPGSCYSKPLIETRRIKGKGWSLKKLQRNTGENYSCSGSLGSLCSNRQAFWQLFCSFSRGTAHAKAWKGERDSGVSQALGGIQADAAGRSGEQGRLERSVCANHAGLSGRLRSLDGLYWVTVRESLTSLSPAAYCKCPQREAERIP